MPTYQKAPKEVGEMAREMLCRYASHKPLLDARVSIDFCLAFADENEQGLPKNFAITNRGIRALAQTRIVRLKERVLGRADAEITLDGNFWAAAIKARQEAALDHELHHLQVKTDKHGRIEFDDLKRPALKLRKHDFDFGWFAVIAERHGIASQEVEQAAVMMTNCGQLFWPNIGRTAKAK